MRRGSRRDRFGFAASGVTVLRTKSRTHCQSPGRKYILISEKAELLCRQPFLTPCELTVAGLAPLSFLCLESVSNDMLSGLQHLELHVARTIRICAAGLCGRSWDGEGFGEWLTTEAPCFGIVHDHPVEQYGLSLNGRPETFIKARESVLLRLSKLLGFP